MSKNISVKHCPKCHHITLVKDSRTRKFMGMKIARLYRRRYCQHCDYYYNTVEIPEYEYKDYMHVKRLLKKVQELDDE